MNGYAQTFNKTYYMCFLIKDCEFLKSKIRYGTKLAIT